MRLRPHRQRYTLAIHWSPFSAAPLWTTHPSPPALSWHRPMPLTLLPGRRTWTNRTSVQCLACSQTHTSCMAAMRVPVRFFFSPTKNRHRSLCVGYMCIYPGCEVPVFPDEATLDQHVQQHYNPYSPLNVHDARTHNTITPSAYYGATTPITPHINPFAAFHDQTPALTAPTFALETFSGPSNDTPTATSYPASAPASKRYQCSYPGCDASIKNAADLTRHAKKHGPKEHGCPIPGCPRKGERAFPRKDKLNDHLKAKHKMSHIG